MNQKTLNFLLIALLVIGGLFFFVQGSDDARGKKEAITLFDDIRSEAIARIRLEQGNNSVELELKDGTWTVPARGNYPADYAKIRGLVLKLLDLKVSERVTDAEENFESLGLTEKAVQNGKSMVKFFDSSGKEIVGVYLGELRKKKTDQQAPPRGQYVRRSDQKQVYLIGEPTTVAASLVTWLDTNITNILASKVESVEQSTVALDKSEKIDFTILRSSAAQDGAPGAFELKEGLSSGEKLKDTTNSQVAGALENLNLSDVLRTDDPALADVAFDRKTVIKLANALRYTVLSAEKGEKGYIKVRVEFDQTLADELKKRAEAAVAGPGGNSNSATSVDQTSGTSSSAKPMEPLASADDAAKIDLKLKDWVFEVQKFRSQKFRNNRDAIVEKPAASSASTSSAPAAAAKAKKTAAKKP